MSDMVFPAGWGCQDGSSIYIGSSKEQIIKYGLGNEDRKLLALALATGIKETKK